MRKPTPRQYWTNGRKGGKEGGREGGLATYLDVHQNVVQGPGSHGVAALRGVFAVEPKGSIAQVEVGQDVSVAARQGLSKLDLPTHGEGQIRGDGESGGKAAQLNGGGREVEVVCEL